MGSRSLRLASTLVFGAAVVGLASSAGAGGAARTQVTVWSAPPATAAIGGLAYGGYAPATGGMITERREVEVSGTGEVRIGGVASTIDPASVQLRDLTDPTGIAITEQRFVPGAVSPTEILAQHVGDPVTVVTAKGEVSGVLRSVDEQVLVLEVGTGDQRRLQVMRRDNYVQDVRLPASLGLDKPSLVWRLATKQPGKHTVEVTYRAEGLAWTADYLAVLDASGKAVDFTAWATVKNATGATFDDVELTLVSGGSTSMQIGANPYGSTPSRPPPTPMRFVVPNPVHLGLGDSVQVEMLPPRTNAKAKSIITYEAMPDPSPSYQAYQGVDCTMFNGVGTGGGRTEVALEVEMPPQLILPEGRVRLFRRHADRLEILTEDPLRASAGVARIRLAPDNEVTGERRALTCNYDERAHAIRERLEVKLDNKGKQAADVVVREFMWRWPVWRIEAEDQKSTHAGPQTQEYRVHVPANGTQTLTYTVLYSW